MTLTVAMLTAVLSPAKKQALEPRRRRPVDEVIVLHRQGRLPLDDTLDPADPILRPRRRRARRSPTRYVHREPLPHQAALGLALSAVAAATYALWAAVEAHETPLALPLGVARGGRATAPVLGAASALFSVAALISATVGRRPGRSRTLLRVTIACSATVTLVVVSTLATVAIGVP